VPKPRDDRHGENDHTAHDGHQSGEVFGLKFRHNFGHRHLLKAEFDIYERLRLFAGLKTLFEQKGHFSIPGPAIS
jgi:hypothetical protein